MDGTIRIKGARVNNLKNIDLDIPRNRLIVITGLSGSGKSSLAFDTLYAEGQRRYVESLSAYARQFLGRMHKPECDYIKGLPPAIAIEQKVTARNPRSTVGTSTEIYDYLRLLFARVGRTYSPVSGAEVRRHTADDVVACALSYSPGTRFAVLAPLRQTEGRSFRQQLEIYLQQGLSRLDVDGEIVRMEDLLDAPQPDAARLLIDRMAVNDSKDAVARLTDSVETAFYEGNGECMLRFYPSRALHVFSTRFEADGMTFEQPDDNMFSFNSPLGACPQCEGFGRVVGIDEHLVVPDTSKSVYDGAVVCWRGEKMEQWKNEFCRRAAAIGFPLFVPYYELTRQQKDILWHGHGGMHDVCIDAFFRMLEENMYKIQYRVMLARYRGKTECPVCHGSRLRPAADYVKVGSRSISELVRMPVAELRNFFDRLTLPEHDERIAARLLTEIRNRLGFLSDVGLGYLTLDRLSNSLSGGESQRINLSTSLGSALVGSLYILDEPSIGLHSRDTARLIDVLRQLRDLGNTVIVVEHDEDIIRAADYIIDIGPEAGRAGGEVVWQGGSEALSAVCADPGGESGRAECLEENPKCFAENPECDVENPECDVEKNKCRAGNPGYTIAYLTGREKIPVPASRRVWNRSVTVRGARANNLKGIDVRFPLNVMTVVTGVSGSGKSTLVRDILYRALKRHFDEVCDRPGEFISLEGDLETLSGVEFIDQNPIGKSSRSNPVTYVKAYDEIRKLMSEQPLARQMEYKASHFSFNADGGRCEECKGEGTVTVEMQFMADLVLECETCHGRRFKKEILDVRFEDKNIYDLLEMTVNQAIEFFRLHGKNKIVRRLLPLQDVGLGYIKLGQSSSTLSGGENQRVKLAYYLAQERVAPTLFIFDEPTTGLHFHDIRRLMESFNALIGRGHTVLIIEHNLDVAKCADYIIDLGPDGGRDGGRLVAAGTPEEVAAGSGHTAHYLREKLAPAGDVRS